MIIEWPDFMKGIRDITLEGVRDERDWTEERHQVFREMVFVTRFLAADVGHSSMIIRFDDERKFEEAKRLLTDANLPWKKWE